MPLQALIWLPRMVLACTAAAGHIAPPRAPPASSPVELRLYPRYHLDHSSQLGQHSLPRVATQTLVLCMFMSAHKSSEHGTGDSQLLAVLWVATATRVHCICNVRCWSSGRGHELDSLQLFVIA